MKPWRKINYEDIKWIAKFIGVSEHYAIACRINYLKARLNESIMEYADLTIWIIETDCPVFLQIWNERGDQLRKAIDSYKYQIASLRAQEKGIKSTEINDAMIERARTVPIETIIEFTRGTARCINPGHDDKHPSMAYWKAKNLAHCFSCNKSWDAIAVYRYQFDCDFKTAVKNLQ